MSNRTPSPTRSRFWWAPLAFVVVSLSLLFGTPIVVSNKLQRLGATIAERDHARVLLNDLEAAGASEAFIGSRPRNPRNDSAVRTARTSAQRDEAQLDSLLRDENPINLSDFITIRTIERSWGRGDTVRSRDPVEFFATAERLDSLLAARSDEARAEAATAQKATVWSAVVLTPLVLVSVGVVVWGARRYQQLAHTLEEERAALAESLETRAALLRGITHDVKNPLGAATGYADLLVEGIGGTPLTAEQLTMVRRIRKLLSDSLETITDLLHVERDSAAAGIGELQPVDLASLVGELVDDYRAAAREKSLSLSLDASATPLIASTQPTHVRHIVGNLLSNAVKYTPASGRVCVRVAAEPVHNGGARMARIEVRDSGAGIPAPLRDRVFEEFYRADAEGQAAGHGVGLAISRRFARALGGDVTVGEAPEGGAMFTLVLPLDRAKRQAAV